MTLKNIGIALILGLIGFFFLFQPADAAMNVQDGSAHSISWTSLLPPVVAIGLALLFKQVFLALFIGIWMGAFLAGEMTITGIFSSFLGSLTGYIVPAAANPDHMSIILFTLLIGGMVGIINANGGTRGIIEKLSGFVTNRIRGQFVTSLMGFVVFFDDYANTMVVGSTMRPLTDKLLITREKLAYLVDSTAAPVATVALISTWIGAMVGFIGDAESAMPDYNEAPYLVFLNSLQYNFYAFLALIFVMMIALSGRDFGPMLKARKRLFEAKNNPDLDRYGVYNTNQDSESGKITSHWANAVIPILVLVIGTVGGLFVTGEGNNIQDIIGSADSYSALLWGSLLGLFTAAGMTQLQKLIDAEATVKAMINGMTIIFEGLIILVLAWALGSVAAEIGTADYLVYLFEGVLNPYWIPVLIFILSAFTSFATGSSWGTMGILMPLVVPMTWSLSTAAGLDPAVAHSLVYASVSSVLAGSVWGDHCSPISDTTILSSLACRCDHIEHVNTQLPYAMVVGAVSVVCLMMVTVLQVPVWLMYVIGLFTLGGVVYKFGTVYPEDAG